MLVIDAVLWVMLCNSLLLEQYSAKGEAPFQVKEFAYSLSLFYYRYFFPYSLWSWRIRGKLKNYKNAKYQKNTKYFSGQRWPRKKKLGNYKRETSFRDFR